MTQFVEQHATVVGNPRYPIKRLDETEYLTGTKVYRVHKIQQHIPCLISLFRRQIKCIYDGKPNEQQKPERCDHSDINSDKSDAENNTDE